MTTAELMQAMADAGAPLEAIIIAVRAIDEKDAEIRARDAAVAERRSADAARKRDERAKPKVSTDNPRTESGRGADAKPAPPNDIYSNPLPTPLETSNDVSPPADLEIERVGEPPLTADEILEAWNATADRCGLPKAKLTPQRRRKLAPLIRNHGLDDFTEAIRALERSPFLRGENDRAWRANFDFFIQPNSFQKLIEGSYDRQAH